jgi:hypothetical protein
VLARLDLDLDFDFDLELLFNDNFLFFLLQELIIFSATKLISLRDEDFICYFFFFFKDEFFEIFFFLTADI